MTETIFITGATGYMGQALVPGLLKRGHRVRALVRPGSASRLPPGCEAVPGDARDAATFASAVAGCTAFIQLVGVSHPGPAKAKQFQLVDRVAGLGAVEAARRAGVRHFVYLSVAQPAPVMGAYIAVRAEVEAALQRSGIPSTVLRPWYVIGPGHRWPLLILPVLWVLERIPATRASAQRLGFVSIGQMTSALLNAIERPAAAGVRIWDVPAIRRGGKDE